IVQFDCPGHFSMLIENVSDLTHGHLHRAYQPFGTSKLLRLEPEADRVEIEYETRIGLGPYQETFLVPTSRMIAAYEYPYHWSNIEDQVRHILFTLPLDEKRNRHMFIFYIRHTAVKIPFWPFGVPRWLVRK